MATDQDYEARILQGRIEKDYWVKDSEWVWRCQLFPSTGTSIRLFISSSYGFSQSDLAQFFGHQCKVLARGEQSDWHRGQAFLGKIKALDAANMQVTFERGSVTVHAGTAAALTVDDDLKIIEKPSQDGDLFRQENQEAEQYLALYSSTPWAPRSRNPDEPVRSFIYQFRPTGKTGDTSVVLTDHAGLITSTTKVHIAASQF